MRINSIVATIAMCTCGIFIFAWNGMPEPVSDSLSILQRSTDISAAKRKRSGPSRPVAPQVHPRGMADPSFGPDGRLYPVPEYLRNQCYYDDGYGRFSPCSNRN
ncbi:MAG: hypothetical protein AB7V13_14360 [Pseudorhodoplanes sp.]|uniref:hypothetical protein n=1 Tax=Pseudorhodoplanes sp. TaxID=1934341 RepID=UPI003D132F0B